MTALLALHLEQQSIRNPVTGCFMAAQEWMAKNVPGLCMTAAGRVGERVANDPHRCDALLYGQGTYNTMHGMGSLGRLTKNTVVYGQK